MLAVAWKDGRDLVCYVSSQSGPEWLLYTHKHIEGMFMLNIWVPKNNAIGPIMCFFIISFYHGHADHWLTGLMTL